MKFVKALNQGIVTDLGVGNKVYNITLEGCEAEDSAALKIKEIFGHLVEVTDMDGGNVESAVAVEGQLPSEGATQENVIEDEVVEVTPEALTEETLVEEEKVEVAVEPSVEDSEEVVA